MPDPTYKTQKIPSGPLPTHLNPKIVNERLGTVTIPVPKANQLAAANLNPGGGDGRVWIKDDAGTWVRNQNRVT